MAYQIGLLPSGHSFKVEPGQPILAAAIAQGIGLPYSCKTGICRTCKGKVESGDVELGEVSAEFLNEGERAQGFALLCRATALSDCSISIRELSRTIAVKTLPCRLSGIERLADDVAVLRVRLPMNQKLLVMPGQYIEFMLKDGQRRSYSIANAPAVDGLDEIELHVRHLPGGVFTDHVFSAMKEREMLRFEGPFGSFYLREESSKPIVMLASGTGFAPVKAMVESMLARGNGADRPVAIYWGGRRRKDIYMAALAERWAAEHGHISFVPVLSNATADCNWAGRTGFVHQAVMQDFPDLSGIEVYACGAPAMVDAARLDFTSHCGLPEDAFFADAFLTEADRAHAAEAS